MPLIPLLVPVAQLNRVLWELAHRAIKERGLQLKNLPLSWHPSQKGHSKVNETGPGNEGDRRCCDAMRCNARSLRFAFSFPNDQAMRPHHERSLTVDSIAISQFGPLRLSEPIMIKICCRDCDCNLAANS